MQAVQYHQFCGPIELADVPEPTPTADGVVIEVRATGLCRSDWHGWQGHDADIRVLPHVPGHELAGAVVEVGKGVTNWRIGDRVTMPFVAGCGACVWCAHGDAQVCNHQFQPGFTAWGSFAERVAVRYADFNLVRLPEEMSFVAAASLGCRMATAYRAVAEQGRAGRNEWLAVHGCGGVGLSAVMIAAALGVRCVSVDIRPAALALAAEFGAEVTIDARGVPNVGEAVREATGGGAHVSLDALGSRATAANSILSLRKRGRHVQVGLLAGADENPSLPMGRVIAWELELVGSHGLAARSYGELFALMSRGVLQPERLVERTIALAEAPAALAAMGEFGGAGITVITP
jgi:alcohol dehydrogenase